MNLIKKLLVYKVVSIINKKNYTMIYKLVSELAINILTTNILDSKLVSKRLI